MSVHSNSIDALNEITESGEKKNRTTQILSVYRREFHPLTDREVLGVLFPGSDNLNLVRPRITELTKTGLLRECSSVRDRITQKSVRTSEIVDGAEQITLF